VEWIKLRIAASYGIEQLVNGPMSFSESRRKLLDCGVCNEEPVSNPSSGEHMRAHEVQLVDCHVGPKVCTHNAFENG
jgi:hypothetical protein